MGKTENKIKFNFNRQKALEAVLYFANKCKRPLSVMHILKLFFYSDLRHLNKYGRPVFGDIYYAMKRGPVASNVYNMLGSSCADYEIKPVKYKDIIIPLRVSNLDYFSDTDIEVFDEVLDEFKNLSAEELSEETHKTKAWQNAWNRKGCFSNRSEMNYEDFLNNASPEQVEHLKEYGELMVF